MYEPKVNLIMTLPGRVMMSKAETLRKVRKPLVNRFGKEVKDKAGNVVWHTTMEYDPAKTESFQLQLEDKDGKPLESFIVRTRGCKPAIKKMTINDEAYKSFISKEVPQKFKVPQGFVSPTIKVGEKIKPKYPSLTPKEQAWLEMTPIERLEWHLKRLCESQNGVLQSYKVLED